MAHHIRRALLATALAAFVAPAATMAQTSDGDEGSDASYLYVASTAAASVDGDRLTLDEVPTVVYFSDRPDRIAGHQLASEFVGDWTSGPDSFADDPPNAVLSILSDGSIEDVTVELLSAEATDGDLSFEFDTLDGELPQGQLGAASLFIDLFNSFTPCIKCAEG